MAPNVPDSYLQARQEQIIKAAVENFSKKGFHQATMKDICKTAGLSPGAVYNYFSSKEDIVARCAEMSLRRNEQWFENAADKKPVDAFKEVMNLLFSLAKQEGIRDALGFDLEMWAESTRNKRVLDILHKNENAAITEIERMVKRGQKEGVFNPQLDSKAIAQTFFSLVIGFEVQLASNPDLDIDAYALVCSALVEGTLIIGSGK